jgi:hypothetical protein
MPACGRERIEERINRYTRLHTQPEELAVGDCVYLKSSSRRLPRLAIIESVLGETIGCRWIYHLSDLQPSLVAGVNVACCEVILSSERGENHTSSLIRKLFVTDRPGSDGHVSFVLDDHLVCRFEMDDSRQRLSPISEWRQCKHQELSPSALCSQLGGSDGSCNNKSIVAIANGHTGEAGYTSVTPQAVARSMLPDLQCAMAATLGGEGLDCFGTPELLDPISRAGEADSGLCILRSQVCTNPDLAADAKWMHAEVGCHRTRSGATSVHGSHRKHNVMTSPPLIRFQPSCAASTVRHRKKPALFDPDLDGLSDRHKLQRLEPRRGRA